MKHWQKATVGRVFVVRFFLIVHDDFFHTSQSKESQEKEYAMSNITRDLLTFAQTLNTCSYLLSTPMHQVQLSPSVIREVNHAVTAALEHEELGN